MPPAHLKLPILAAVDALLRPLGYRKKLTVFSRHLNDVVHLIEVQGSRNNTSAEARFTVNTGVFAEALVYPDIRDSTRPTIAGAHWRARLGGLSPECKDIWWAVSSLEQAETAAQDIASQLERYALPALSAFPSLESLVLTWRSGRCPGLTENQRKDYLARLGAGEPVLQNDG